MFELGTFAFTVPFATIMLTAQGIKIAPQQHAWIPERLGKYHTTLLPGLNTVLPLVDRVTHKHVLKGIPLDVSSQICITKDNVQLQAGDTFYFQVTDPMRTSYGSSNSVIAIIQLAQAMLRSVVSKPELDKTFEERNFINHSVVSASDETASNWSVKVLRYEVKGLTPLKEILHTMQAQIMAERERRALIAASEGRRQEQIGLVSGAREAAVQKSEGEKQITINKVQGKVATILAVAEANAQAIQKIGQAIHVEGGTSAVSLKVTEEHVSVFDNLAKQGNTLIMPGNMGNLSMMTVSASAIVKQQQRPGT